MNVDLKQTQVDNSSHLTNCSGYWCLWWAVRVAYIVVFSTWCIKSEIFSILLVVDRAALLSVADLISQPISTKNSVNCVRPRWNRSSTSSSSKYCHWRKFRATGTFLPSSSEEWSFALEFFRSLVHPSAFILQQNLTLLYIELNQKLYCHRIENFTSWISKVHNSLQKYPIGIIFVAK